MGVIPFLLTLPSLNPELELPRNAAAGVSKEAAKRAAGPIETTARTITPVLLAAPGGSGSKYRLLLFVRKTPPEGVLQ